MTKWLMAEPQERIEDHITERPLLNACAGRYVIKDAVTLDAENRAAIKGDVRRMPIRGDAFAAVFMDTPWVTSWMENLAAAIREALRVAKVAYILSPFTYGGSGAAMTRAWVCWQPGVQRALLLVRYERTDERQLELTFWKGQRRID